MLKRDVFVTFSGHVLRGIIVTIAAAILARSLGPDARGVFALAIVFPRTAQLLFRWGQDSVNNTFPGRYKDNRPALFAQSMLLSTISAVLTLIAIAIYNFSFAAETGTFAMIPRSVLLLSLLLGPAEIFQANLETLARGSERITSTAVISVCGSAFLATGYFIFLGLLHYGLAAAMIITIAQPILLSIARVWQVRDFATFNLKRISLPILRHSLRFGGIVSISLVATYLVSRISIFLLGHFGITDGEIGLYAVALMMAEQLRLIPAAVAQAFLPRLSNSPELRHGHTPRVFRLTTIAAALSTLGLSIVAPLLMLLLFGKEYTGSIVPFLIMLPGLACHGCSRVVGMDLWVRNKPQYGMINNWVALIVTTILSVALIPHVGIRGAALGNSLGLCLLASLSVLAYHRVSGVPLRELIVTRSDWRDLWSQSLDIIRTLQTRLRTAQASVPQSDSATTPNSNEQE